MNKLWAVKLILHLQSIIFSSFLLNSHVLGTELVGRAILSADTFAPGSTSGQFKQTNRTVPFIQAQPVQGFSAVIPGSKPGTYLVLSDNGFGGKSNSADYLLRIYGVEPDFVTGKVFPVDVQTGERLPSFNHRSFLELNDRNRQLPWNIISDRQFYPNSQIPVHKTIRTNRLLTGGDFDIESFRRTRDGNYWVGDEFGPFLLHFGSNGELLTAPIGLPNFLNFGKLNFVKSPEHPTLEKLPNRGSQIKAANLAGSRGFEGMAMNPSGNKLYVMLEGALKDDPQINRLLIHEFDLAQKNYTGKIFSYKLENSDYAIGELTAINNREFIVIERDHRQGDPRNREFRTPAKFKRIYKIDISKIDRNGFVAKELLVDLLNISDPKCISGNGKRNCKFTFPFVTIESVLPIDAQTLLVINDNNYADSIGRTPKRIDNTEFITIRINKPLLLEKFGKSQ